MEIHIDVALRTVWRRGQVGNWAAGTIQQPSWERGLKCIVKRVS